MQTLRFKVRCFDSKNRPTGLDGGPFSLSDLKALLVEALLLSKAKDQDHDEDEDDQADEGSSSNWARHVTVEEQLEGEAIIFSLTAENVSFQTSQVIRNFVLSGDFDNLVAHRLGQDNPYRLSADRSQFAEDFEQSMLSLYNLTDHQKEKLAECYHEDGSPGGDVHLMAPAGAGKTFLALHRILKALSHGAGGSILFVARNEALAFFAATWLLKRLPRGRQTRRKLRRLHFLNEPFSDGPRRPRVRGNLVELVPAIGPGLGAARYELVVVDEAHHIYSDDQCRRFVEGQISPGVTQRMLLSDVSQSWGRRVPYPEGLRDVMLYEVVRCSKRIVAGAMAFQLGGEEKLLTKCHHEATGPPLKSYLFDLPSVDGQCASYFDAYSEHVARALEHVMTTFDGLNLRNRVAIVVPNNQFRDALKPVLAAKLRTEFPTRNFCLVDSVLASADLGAPVAAPRGECEEEEEIRESKEKGKEDEEQEEDETTRKRAKLGPDEDDEDVSSDEQMPDSDGSLHDGEWLVLDTIHQIDGLERLIVIGVGLDSAIEEGKDESPRSDAGAGEGGVLETRSMLYRAMTRAHLMFVVVNEFLRGGWLEFLGSVRLRQDEAFSSEAALQKCETQAVEGVVKARIIAALTEAAEEAKLELSSDVLNLLSTDVAQRHEAGEEEATAVARVFAQWLGELRDAEGALRKALESAAPLVVPEGRLKELTLPIAVGLHRGEFVQLSQVASETMKGEAKKYLEKDGRENLKSARLQSGRPELPDQVLNTLQGQVVSLVEEGQDVRTAARRVLADWTVEEDRVRAAFPPDDLTEEHFLQACIKVSSGLAPQDAVNEVVEEILKKRRETEVAEAVGRSIETLGPQDLICCKGCRVRVKDLGEGFVLSFDTEKRRWRVKLEGRFVPETVKNSQITVLSQPGSLEERQTFLRAQRKELEQFVDLPERREGDELAAWVDTRVRRFRELAGLVETVLEEVAEENDIDDKSKPGLIARTVVRYCRDFSQEDESNTQGPRAQVTGGRTNWGERAVRAMIQQMRVRGADPQELTPAELVGAYRELREIAQLERQQREAQRGQELDEGRAEVRAQVLARLRGREALQQLEEELRQRERELQQELQQQQAAGMSRNQLGASDEEEEEEEEEEVDDDQGGEIEGGPVPIALEEDEELAGDLEEDREEENEERLRGSSANESAPDEGDEDEEDEDEEEDDDEDDVEEDYVQEVQELLSDARGEATNSCSGLKRALHIEIEEWRQENFGNQSDLAELRSALEAAIRTERLLLTDAAIDSLVKRLEEAVSNGQGLHSAVQSVLKEWQKQMVRRQVQQTIWDPSGNATKQVTGMVRFMPFKQQTGDHFDYLMLMNVFEMLPFESLGALARVCKRWHGVASDPSWKPEMVAYVWGQADRTGLGKACEVPTLLELSISKKILKVHCGDASTFLVTQMGEVWFWGASWSAEDPSLRCAEPTLIPELRDVITVTTSPPGYHHGRAYLSGYTCAALTRRGALYTWGTDRGKCLLTSLRDAKRPVRVRVDDEVWRSHEQKVLHVALGLHFMALCVHRGPGEQGQPPRTAVLSVGMFNTTPFSMPTPHELTAWPELENRPLKELVAGNFHCCAVTTRGELFTWGSREGADRSNGNLLGTGARGHGNFTGRGPGLAWVDAPTLVPNLGPVAEVRCSSYSNVAILLDGRVYTWGDCDGNALGHEVQECHDPHWVRSLRWHKAAHGSVAYTNGAVATKEGRVFVWGGNYWEGGISVQEHENRGTAEVHWKGVPGCYKCVSVALSFRHGFLVFQKQP